LATPCFPGDPSHAGTQRLIDEDRASPFWGPHSLGPAWLELAARPDTQLKLPLIKEAASGRGRKPPTDVQVLTHQVERLAIQAGGVSVPELLDWAMRENWAPARFFSALQSGLLLGRLEDKNGLLLIKPTMTD
jgi:hypothetical protein